MRLIIAPALLLTASMSFATEKLTDAHSSLQIDLLEWESSNSEGTYENKVDAAGSTVITTVTNKQSRVGFVGADPDILWKFYTGSLSLGAGFKTPNSGFDSYSRGGTAMFGITPGPSMELGLFLSAHVGAQSTGRDTTVEVANTVARSNSSTVMTSDVIGYGPFMKFRPALSKGLSLDVDFAVGLWNSKRVNESRSTQTGGVKQIERTQNYALGFSLGLDFGIRLVDKLDYVAGLAVEYSTPTSGETEVSSIDAAGNKTSTTFEGKAGVSRHVGLKLAGIRARF